MENPIAYTPTQYGENKHAEYGWSEEIEETILQFSFQLIRCDNYRQIELSKRLEFILKQLVSNCNNMHLGKYQELMITLYKLIAYTRDIIQGKGECDLSYMQIVIWYKFYPELAKYALSRFMVLEDEQHPYGSWKDIKYFCNYCKDNFKYNEDHPLIDYCVSLVNNQLKVDLKNKSKSLLAKWIPREKSKKFGWLFDKLSQRYFSQYLDTAKTPEQKILARLKAKTEYRRIISKLNKEIDTVQIKQCDNQWSKINHSKTSSITMLKQSKAFLNLTVNLEPIPRSYEEDRIQCAKNLHYLIEKDEMHGKCIGLNTFAKTASRLIKNGGTKMEFDLLNSQWRNYIYKFPDLAPMIAIIDGANSEDQFYTALGIGCLIAEKSSLGKRVLTCSENPIWHNLEMCNTFSSMIESIDSVESIPSANFYKALNVVFDNIIEKKLTQEEVSGLILVILSDMQIEKENIFDTSTLYDSITEKYYDAGVQICGKPYEPPHIIFWNLRSTNGFPCLSNDKNVTMISGYHDSILKRFCEKESHSLKGSTPWLTLVHCMRKKRYQPLENMIKKELGFFE
jgi:Domain of unknown function (DUF2828)